MKKKLDDSELVQLALQGNQDAFAQILAKYKDAIAFNIGKMVKNSEDKEDLIMEAFAKAFNKLENYRPEFAFSTWLFNIAINHTIDFLRKKKLQTFSLNAGLDDESESEFQDQVKDYKPDPEEAFIREQRAALMRDVLDTLSPHYREMIKYRYFDELSYEEISDKMKIPLGTVKGHLFRSKSLLYNLLNKSKEHF